MKQLLATLLFIFSFFTVVRGNQNQVKNEDLFWNAYEQISNLIENPTPKSFKKAVFIVEGASYNNIIPTSFIENDIQQLVSLVKAIRERDNLDYSKEDKNSIETYAAIFRAMTDTTRVSVDDKVLINVPFSYDLEDVFGQKDWSNMFVTKLLATNKGNCHSLPYLYKILAEELGETAHLALAPNHIYIKHYSKKTGWYNTELTSASFPIDAWLTASGYIHLDTIRNGVYMDTLSQKESLALTLIDLAKGYERKFGVLDGKFILKAVDKALEVDSNFINALLLKAETQKKLFENEMLINSMENPNDLIEQSEEYRNLFLEMQNLYVKIHKLGYRQMPEEMYLDWLNTLQEEREKYQNKTIPFKE